MLLCPDNHPVTRNCVYQPDGLVNRGSKKTYPEIVPDEKLKRLKRKLYLKQVNVCQQKESLLTGAGVVSSWLAAGHSGQGMKKRHQDKQRRQLLNQQQDQAKRIFFPRELPTAYDDYVYLRYERLLRARSLSKQSLWQGEMFRHYAVMLLWVLLASLVIAAKHVDWKVAPQSATAIPQSNTPSAPASPLRVNPPMQPTPAGESHLPVQSQTLGSSSHLRQSPLLNLSDQGMQSHPLDTAIQYLPLRSLNTVDSPTFFLSTAQK